MIPLLTLSLIVALSLLLIGTVFGSKKIQDFAGWWLLWALLFPVVYLALGVIAEWMF